MSQLLRQQIEKITPLTDAEFDYILSHFVPKKFKKHQFLIQEGNEVLNDFFVLEGCLKLYHVSPDGKEHIVQFGLSDWWICDFNAYFNQTKATLNLQCIENTEVYSLSYCNYLNILRKYNLSNYFLDKSIKGHIANQRRILSLLALSPKERYEQFLHLYPTLIQRIPKSILSLYLGVSRETLSRLYKKTKTIK